MALLKSLHSIHVLFGLPVIDIDRSSYHSNKMAPAYMSPLAVWWTPCRLCLNKYEYDGLIFAIGLLYRIPHLYFKEMLVVLPSPPRTYYLGTGALQGPLKAYYLGTWGASH